MLCPFETEEKQALLEAPNLQNRRETLVTLMEFALRSGVRRGQDAVMDEGSKTEGKMLEFLVCPFTRSPLTYDAEKLELISKGAKLAFPIRAGIPVMLIDEARELD